MKKSDIAMIILIASISMLVSYFVAKAIVGDTKDEAVKVKTAEPISTNIDEPDSSIFNSNAINPTVEVIIGNGSTQTQNGSNSSSSSSNSQSSQSSSQSSNSNKNQ